MVSFYAKEVKSSSLKIGVVLLLLVSGGICIVFIYNYLGLNTTTQAFETPVVPTPTPAPTKNKEVHSIEGTKNFIMHSQENADNTTTYSFATEDISGENNRTIFTKTLSSKDSLTIPANSWSPDMKYVFITGNINNTQTVLVFDAEGEAVAPGQQYVDVVPLFAEKKPEFIFTEATGWAAPTLIQLKTTTKTDGSNYPYWFDLSNLSFIQLARH